MYHIIEFISTERKEEKDRIDKWKRVEEVDRGKNGKLRKDRI